jgi:hypothetical protein
MVPMINNNDRCAVLEAADRWLAAAEAVASADEIPRRTDAEQGELDSAEVILAAVVKAWRRSR